MDQQQQQQQEGSEAGQKLHFMHVECVALCPHACMQGLSLSSSSSLLLLCGCEANKRLMRQGADQIKLHCRSSVLWTHAGTRSIEMPT